MFVSFQAEIADELFFKAEISSKIVHLLRLVPSRELEVRLFVFFVYFKEKNLQGFEEEMVNWTKFGSRSSTCVDLVVVTYSEDVELDDYNKLEEKYNLLCTTWKKLDLEYAIVRLKKSSFWKIYTTPVDVIPAVDIWVESTPPPTTQAPTEELQATPKVLQSTVDDTQYGITDLPSFILNVD
ncbi:hypothetical protein M9H77_23241 [Catharanthus roseus]|uniref:Uncharacterized protein n=1 Tax=Catharanthus roseus TaxID=4058 RepID=A0ACC0AVH1_CATRO|nr:hypothetical protein M9H77_23241 [Catharanthus roseus]